MTKTTCRTVLTGFAAGLLAMTALTGTSFA